MKRYFLWLIIALVVILSSGAVYGQGERKEIIVKGTIPTEWGSLRCVVDKGVTLKEFYFEDNDGTIRIVYIRFESQGKVNTEVGDIKVIKRRK